MYDHELPTLSQIADWDVRHLTDAAEHWAQTADLWEDTFHGVWRATMHPGGTAWEGDAADAAQDLTWRDLVRVRGCAEALRTAARIAQTGAESLCDVKRLTLDAIDDAQRCHFIVGEDLSVTHSPQHAADHLTTDQAHADDHAEDIKHLAANLVALDHDIALRLHDKALGVSEGIPYLAQGCT
jgi:hypothetical protein